jgi:hypothetical protein
MSHIVEDFMPSQTPFKESMTVSRSFSPSKDSELSLEQQISSDVTNIIDTRNISELKEAKARALEGEDRQPKNRQQGKQLRLCAIQPDLTFEGATALQLLK